MVFDATVVPVWFIVVEFVAQGVIPSKNSSNFYANNYTNTNDQS